MARMLMPVVVLTLLQGCANPFSEYYYDNTEGIDLAKADYLVLPTAAPVLYRGADQDQDILRMYEDNYELLGYSSFSAGDVDEKDAIKQAAKVSAEIVYLHSTYVGSESGSVPVTVPIVQNSTTSLYGSNYGAGGYSAFSGAAYSTAYGSHTTYIPYTVHRSDYFATYWIKMKPPRLGILPRDLTPELKRKLASNKGLLIYAVVKGSPAFEADILSGDVLKAVGDFPMLDYETFGRAIAFYEGKEVSLKIVREGQEVLKTVRLRDGRY